MVSNLILLEHHRVDIAILSLVQTPKILDFKCLNILFNLLPTFEVKL